MMLLVPVILVVLLASGLGLDIGTLKVMIPKSTNHFYQNFARVSAQVIHVRTPGAVTPDMTIIPFTKRDGNYWPKVENPFALSHQQHERG